MWPGRDFAYVLFGLLLITGYGCMVQQGVEPFSARTQRPAHGRTGTPGAHENPTQRYRRAPSFVWIGGFGGK